MLKNLILEVLHKPKLCNKINISKYPWGWKSNRNIEEIIKFPLITNDIEKLNVSINRDLTYIHEYKVKEYAEEVFIKSFYAYINDYNFLNSKIFSPTLANGLNYLRSESLCNFNLFENIKIKKVDIIDSCIKYGSITNNNKFLGYYNEDEIIHEISAGIIGPEISHIWDQRSIKQKVRISLDSIIETSETKDIYRKDIVDLERDLMTTNGEWHLNKKVFKS